MDLEFYNSLTKGLKLKFGKFQAMLQTNVEVTGEKLVRELFRSSTLPPCLLHPLIINGVKYYMKRGLKVPSLLSYFYSDYRTCGAAMWRLTKLHNFIQQRLNSCSAQFQILLTACLVFSMVTISDSGPAWK